MKGKVILSIAMASLFAFSGCSTRISSNIPDDGVMTQDDVTFPEIGDEWIEAPTFPNFENLGKIEKGMSKDQIYHLISHPQYAEGLFGVREWDYVFNLKEKAGDPDKICQYKIIWDKDMRVGSTFWNPVGCANPSPKAEIRNEATLEADFLFDFDKDNLKADGHKTVKMVADNINVATLKEVVVEGYTDRLGSEAYNLDLSKRRANTVKNELIANGIPGDKIRTVGMGKADQVEPCPGLKGQALRDCLRPNRRVIIKYTNFGE